MNIAASIEPSQKESPCWSSPADAPLTLAQRRVWSLSQIGGDHVMGAYCIKFHIQGLLDVDAAMRAIRLLGARHGALQTRFLRSAGGRIDQQIDARPLEARFIDLSSNEKSRRDEEAQSQIQSDACFDLSDGPPAHALLLRFAQDEYLIALTIHPIVCDAASLRVIGHDFANFLSAESRDETPRQPTLGQDVGFGAAEQKWLRSEACGTALNFWRNHIPRGPATAIFPTRHQNLREQTDGRGCYDFTLRQESSRGLRQLENHIRRPVSILLLTAFSVLVSRYNLQCGATLGLVIENREDAARRAEVGRFEDVVPLLVRLTTGLTFSQAAQQMATALAEATAHQTPFERIAQEISDRDGEAVGSFIQALFEHRGPVSFASALSPGFTIDRVETSGSRADAPIVLTTQENADGTITGRINFADGLFDPKIIQRAATHFIRIIDAATADPDIALRDIQLLNAEELDDLSAPYPDAECDDVRPIHEIIAAQAQRQPEAPAIYHGESCWRHGELDKAANRLAHQLRELGAGSEICVGIALRRSPEAIMAILAVLKAGAAFVPIDPDHPQVRIRHMLKDAGVTIVLTENALRRLIPDDVDVTILAIDQAGPDLPVHAPDAVIAPHQLAYVIYTSGSTGAPKGVAVEHGPLSRHCQSTVRVYEMNAQSCELAFLPFSSDGGHERWITPLMVGGSVVLPDRLWTPEETFAAMRRHGVNNASFPTAYLQHLAEWAATTGSAPPLRLYSFGGEGLPQKTFDLLSSALKAQWLINGYGPTETIMTPMVWKVRAGAGFEGLYAPIGRAVGRRRIYILDKDLNPAPIGVTGELYIGGDGVARGYVGNPALTAERFVKDPFGGADGRLYRSGDLARWRDDGSVEFIGRSDHQVKLRGFRIELGEIETALRAEPNVSECAVILLTESGRQPALVAYVVPAKGTTLDPVGLRKNLARQLPDYMTPSAVLIMDRLPLNANAKLDRAALPSPAASGQDLAPPTTKWEEALVRIWRDVLGLSEIGVTQNFFEIGGNSIAALRILSKIKLLHPDTSVSIADLFNHQDIRALAPLVDSKRARSAEAEIIRLRANGDKPTLYCFPGLLVSTREYMRLVDYLGPDQPATGFLCYSLSEDKKIDASVEEITARYADRIRSESKGRPCFFLGWSWGGLLAYEAARMLKDDIDLRLIAMVDVCDMDTDFAVGAVPAFKPGERDELQRRIIGWLVETRMRADWDRLLGSMDAQAYDQFLRFVGNSEEDLPTDGPDIGSREHTFWVLIDNALIFRRYHMKPFDCPISSWAAEDSLNRGLNLIDWRSLSREARAAEIIPGTTHLHIIGATAFHARLALHIDEAFDLSKREPAKTKANDFFQMTRGSRL
ncbi:non-ribosomal peptide synthetase [Methylocapsa palsarum]|uniref:Amino acid adenylation domain-containing protein n=1 Tax=Methylocapsa palsarum TaxID=1612308 RepID=A0A1I3W7L2_9HYPH|nr:non-ribosomal peptide synthetase [Methylocapsa palsarum]SFK03410.1 amino acid adenylation domain-containing protein [Methylocapsa palsarum]